MFAIFLYTIILLVTLIWPTYNSECEFSNEKGDGYCDDYNNNQKCEFDGGDCCGSNVNREFCISCQCKDPNHSEYVEGNIDQITELGIRISFRYFLLMQVVNLQMK